ncbi:MAG: hypothetical protein VW894_00025 [Gammaproteobacteria bacterium]
MLKIFYNLFNSLELQNIPFCNWKGHYASVEHLEGRGDLDLYVPLSFKAEFEQIIKESNFKKVLSFQARHDFIEHYYGQDKDTLQFVHLHVYFKIVTGEHISKNYILPIEQYVQKNTESSNILPALSQSARINIFLVRFYLKIGSFYGLLQYFRELKKYTSEWKSFDQSTESTCLPDLELSKNEIDYLRYVYKTGSIFKQIYFSLRLKFKLRKFRRRSFIKHQIYKISNFMIRFLNKLFWKKKKLFPSGIVVAICGLDGSGKSTLVSNLIKTYSIHFSVKVFHLGRPHATGLTYIFKPIILIISIFRSLRASKTSRTRSTQPSSVSIIYAFRSVLLAYEREALTKKAHKASKNGYLIICDRYPGLNNGKMDSPRIPFNQSKGWIYQLLFKTEQKLYKKILPADIIFNLEVPLEIALKRNQERIKFGKETEQELRDRFLLNAGAEFLAKQKKTIDASISSQELLALVNQSLWASINTNNKKNL